MNDTLLLKNVRPMGGEAVDVLVRGGRIHQMSPGITEPAGEATLLDGANQLLLPGLVNAHAHVDKNLLGQGWHSNQVQGSCIRDFVENERRLRRELGLSARTQSERELRAAIAAGTTHLRSHVDVDTEAGLTHFEGVLATREAFEDTVTLQLVAFPQSGMLVRPGTVELLEEAVRMGAEVIGGLDPSTVDRDPVRHIDTVFEIAERYGVEMDLHLHEPGMLGAFAVELIAERTRALGMQGRVTISHAYCLGMVDEAYLDRLIGLLVDSGVTIMSLGTERWPFPPLKRLHEAGVSLCTGTDGVRDTWSPYNSVDLLERVKLLGYRSALWKDEELEMLLEVATCGGASVVGDREYGLEVGSRADFVVVPGEVPAEAIIECPPRTYVVKGGRLVAAGGACLLAEALP